LILSICITTRNRADFIGETLDSILAQLEDDTEIVVVDGASTDATSEVVSGYALKAPAVRYFRETENSGFDGDYDKAVAYAQGDFCWLATDDDVLAPGALARVKAVLDSESPDVLVVDAEIRDLTLSATLKPRRLGFSGLRRYGAEDGDRLLTDAGDALSFIGGTIVRRSAWMSRERRNYYGTLFVHVGVLFQSPPIGKVVVLGEPLVIIRAGNAMWRPRSFEIWSFMWPELIWGFPGYGPASKSAVTPIEPWRKPRWLLVNRAMGSYSMTEYRRYLHAKALGVFRPLAFLIAAAPGIVVNALAALYLRLTGKAGSDAAYDLVTCSRFSTWMTRLLIPSPASRSS
jgi:glycosyltransferase involved in cell wall biosynthesis